MLTPLPSITSSVGRLQPARSASSSGSGRCTSEEIRANMGSVELCPLDVLPPGSLPWFALLLLAACGYDTYVYPVGSRDATSRTSSIWNAWIGPLADVREDHNGRISIARLGATCRGVLDELSDAEHGAPEVTLLCQLLDKRAHLWDWAGFLVDPCEAAIELLETHIGWRDTGHGTGHGTGRDTGRSASLQEVR